MEKAYDKVPQDLLWRKLENLGLGTNFIGILKALYNKSFMVVQINGLDTKRIYPERGLKQGCPLSPLLFSINISGLGQKLEARKEGVQIMGTTISGLLFADDLILISRDREGVKYMTNLCQRFFEDHGLTINCEKCNILQMKGENLGDIKLSSTTKEYLGCIKKAIKYKYLGINIKLTEECNIFDFKRTEMTARAKSYAAKIITLASESHDPCQVASALWKQVATEGILYGIQAVSITKKIMRELDSIQAGVGAFILGVRRSCSHEAIRKELGWKSMSAIIYTRKLQYWDRLATLDTENWAHKAYRECFNAKGKSQECALLSRETV